MSRAAYNGNTKRDGKRRKRKERERKTEKMSVCVCVCVCVCLGVRENEDRSLFSSVLPSTTAEFLPLIFCFKLQKKRKRNYFQIKKI
jgi:hypothetical protein